VAAAEVILRRAEPVMGTVVSFDLRPQGLALEVAREAMTAACAMLHRVDATFSLYRPDSPMSRLRRGELTLAQCPPEIGVVLELCTEAKRLTDGWFDPWRLPGGLDPTGLVKGWAAREAASALTRAGVGAGLVNAAGDIVGFGAPQEQRAWRIGIRSPDSPEQLCGVIELHGAVATSGTYERGSHIRDVRAGRPASGVSSASVCGPDLALADALATALVAAGERGFDWIRTAGYEALIVLDGGETSMTEGFPALAASDA
jgi:thiamine biosynthesis lipoprotein